MKKLLYILTILLVVVSFSCEEDFSPKGDFKEQYVLFGKLTPSSYSNYALIHILKTYNVNGLNPYDNNSFKLVTKADVVLKSGRYEYKLEEDTLAHPVLVSLDSLEVRYYKSNIDPMLPRQEFTLTATLPDSTILTTSTKIPEYPTCTFSYNPEYFNTEIARLKYGSPWVISWLSTGYNLYLPKLLLAYYVWTEGEEEQWKWKYIEVEIPLRYINNQPVYPKEMWDSKLEYSFDAIDSTMAQISAGDINKSNYRIYCMFLTIKTYDLNFGKYYSSTNGCLDEYSIRLDESTYSNISGGIGVFGSSLYGSYHFEVDTAYAAKFGYEITSGD